MKNKIKKRFIISILFVVLVFAMGFGACKKPETNQSTPPSSEGIGPNVPVEVNFTVTFVTNGGTPVNSLTIKEGETINLADYVTEKEGSYFYGWTLDAEFTNRADTIYTVVANTTLYAQWGNEVTYSLIFDTNGGTAIAPVQYRPNAYLVAPEEPTKENYTFGGWYKDKNLTQEFSFFAAPQMPKKDLTIYAKWNALNAIEFDTVGGTPIDPIYGSVGDLVGEIQNPTKKGYIFEGWYADANYTTP